jgi:hypothetical protein
MGLRLFGKEVFMSKLAGKNLKFCRCPVEGHGQDCGLAGEMRQPVARTTEKSLSMKEAVKEYKEVI